MMRARSPIALLLLLALAAAPAAMAQEWSGRGRLQGDVKDAAGKPVEGARVYLRMGDITIDPNNLTPGPDVIVTDARGKWSTLGLAGGPWSVLIVKEGLMASEGRVRVNEFGPAQPIKVVLNEIPREVQQESEGAKAVQAIERGNQLLQQEKYSEARAAYEEALAKVPEESHPAILRGIARTYFQDKQVDQAIATIDRALVMKPDDVESLNLIISLLVAAGREKDAEPYMAKLPAGTAVDPTTLLNLGIKKYNEGNGEGALADFDRVVRENPTMPEAYYYRGLAHLSLGHNPEAKADFEKMLAIDPNHANANDAREFIKNL
jgi:tetratricopeptide (TPR) repeat protein